MAPGPLYGSSKFFKYLTKQKVEYWSKSDLFSHFYLVFSISLSLSLRLTVVVPYLRANGKYCVGQHNREWAGDIPDPWLRRFHKSEVVFRDFVHLICQKMFKNSLLIRNSYFPSLLQFHFLEFCQLLPDLDFVYPDFKMFHIFIF